MNERFTRIKISFVLAAIIMLSLTAFSFLRIDGLMKTSSWVNHTATVKFDLETYFSSMKDMETALHGYLLTNDSVFAKEFQDATKATAIRMNHLKIVTADNYSQRENLKVLQNLAVIRIANMQRALQLGVVGQSPEEKAASIKVRTNRIKLRAQIDKMMNEEDLLLKIRKKSLLKQTEITPVLAAFLTFISIAVLLLSYFGIYRELKTSNSLRDDLEKNNQSLARLNTELESFTYISSHDLQEPLRKIQMFVSRIIDRDNDALSDAGRNYLHRTQDSAHRMQNLIRDLLSYSRLSAEIFQLKTTDLNQLIEEIRDDFDEDIDAKHISITVIGAAQIKIIVSQFYQLLVNLISNSIKFAAADKPLQISIHSETVKGSAIGFSDANSDLEYSKITVSDNGIGFEPEYKDRIFKVFQRVHIDPKYVGTGIGLAIVKKIVDNHKGFITADGEVNNGAVFTIYIPA